MRWATAGLLVVLAGCSLSPDQEEIDRKKLAQIYTEKGIAYLSQGQPQNALADLRHALEIDPDNAAAHEAIAVLYEKFGMDDKAAEHYHRALALQPDDARLLNNYGLFLCNRGDYDAGMKRLVRAANNKLYAQRWKAMTNAGLCALKAGRLQEAEDWLRQALKLEPDAPQPLAAMARLMAKKRRWLAARAFLQRYEAVAEPTPQLLQLGVQIESALGDEQAAAAYRSRLERTTPKNHP
ncbi:type IV pilus assembly protein PilF [Methylomarinovum tepidoasis]|uniref:Type IV pilus assembly protein PilF n=1 Tax=Methylomarinovum tepidoasis TaxID=2840183 RepID=A0AAU9CPB4_9GAMM|nr:type IV pilus biogenesis/stability protein PilW [Methylomarinovum sp. IN45]BCX89482.1 type IV pilus assembly protein PilF [Methylomarinovum sp. IN45]